MAVHEHQCNEENCHCNDNADVEFANSDNLFEEDANNAFDVITDVFNKASEGLSAIANQCIKAYNDNKDDEAKAQVEKLFKYIDNNEVYKYLFFISPFMDVQGCFDEIEDSKLSGSMNMSELISSIENKKDELNEELQHTSKDNIKTKINNNLNALKDIETKLKQYNKYCCDEQDKIMKEGEYDNEFIEDYLNWFIGTLPFSDSFKELKEPFTKLFKQLFVISLKNKENAEKMFEEMLQEDLAEVAEDEEEEDDDDEEKEEQKMNLHLPNYVHYILELCEVNPEDDDETIEMKSNLDIEAFSQDVIEYYGNHSNIEQASTIKSADFVEYISFRYFKGAEKLSLLYSFVNDQIESYIQDITEKDDMVTLNDELSPLETFIEDFDKIHDDYLHMDEGDMDDFDDEDFDDEDEYDDDNNDDMEEDQDEDNNDSKKEEENYTFTY